MGHSRSEKAASRERILEEASRQARIGGLASLNIVKLMKNASLTHGGFYGHFASRADLEVAALQRALIDGENSFNNQSKSQDGEGLESIAKRYLSRAHRDSRVIGCAIAALGAEVAQSEHVLRSTMEPHVERFINKVRETVPDEEEAIAAVCAMVGGIVLARVITNPERSDAILSAVVNVLSKARPFSIRDDLTT